MSVRIADATPERRKSTRDDIDVTGPACRRTVVLMPYRRGHRHVWRYPFDFTMLRLRT